MPAPPPIDTDQDLEMGPDEPDADDAMNAADGSGELDPQFAADAGQAFPDLDDDALTALQRAIQGLMVR